MFRVPSRGFVMPMVLLALIVVGLGVGVAMSRFAAQSKVIARQARAYHEHHAGQGLQEAIGAWLRQQNGRSIADAINPADGHAMDIVLQDGSVVSVYLRDGQGMALGDLSALPPGLVEEAGVILTNLVQSVRPDEYLRLTRSVGPSSVSANTAPEPVLRAVTRAIAGDLGDAFADELLRVRARGSGLTRQDITSAINSSGLSSEQRTAALRLLAVDVELWAVIVELRGGVGAERGRLLSRYGGLARLRLGATSRSNAAGSTQLGSFLTWKELDASTDGFNLGDLDDDT